MRIVGGRHRGRRLSAPPGRDVRPTTDRTREALFNILVHGGWGIDGTDPLDGAVVLDAFCGTGALGLEALSRGARHAVLLDSAAGSLAVARANCEALGEGGRVTLLRGDAVRPPPARAPCTLAFLDPPYGRDLAPAALSALAAAGWFAADAVVVVEETADAAFAPPEGFIPLDTRRYSDTTVRFLRWRATA